MRRPPLLILVCVQLFAALAHDDVAGSCDSPHSGHHGATAQTGTGGYVLRIDRERNTVPPRVVFRLESERQGQTFRGFQLICEACRFLHLPTEDAHLNTRHCSKPGRVSHTNNRDKSSVEIEAELHAAGAREILIEYYVVKTLKEWYGPMRVTTDDRGNVLEGDHTPTAESLMAGQSDLLDIQTDDEGDDDGHEEGDGDDDGHEEADGGGGISVTGCLASTEPDFTCMVKLRDYFILHWMVQNDTSQTASSSTTRLQMLVSAKTSGWASLAFAKVKGKMHPADAVLGWVDDDHFTDLHAYHIKMDDVRREDRNASLFHLSSIDRTNDWLHLRFAKIPTDGLVSIDLADSAFLNYATGKDTRLSFHDRWGSVELNFLTGQTHEVSSRKFYQAHGCLMILAWIVLIPFSMTVARSKWAPSSMGLYGWFDLHRGLHLFAVVAVVSATLIALVNFQSIETRTGKVHRLLGILVSAFLACQVLMGLLRPAAESPQRQLFAVAHAWGGRCLALLAWVTVFVGISAFRITANSDPAPWISAVVLLLIFQLCAAAAFEWGNFARLRNRRQTTQEVDMAQIPYARPVEQDSDENYATE